MSKEIFGAYDIRGIYPKQINEEFAYSLGSAFVDFLRKDTNKPIVLVVGQDVRHNSKELKRYLIAGMMSHRNVQVHDIGLATMPFHFYSTQHAKAEGGIMITASHNPPEYAGFKCLGPHGKVIGGLSGLSDIAKLIKSESKKVSPLPLVSGSAEMSRQKLLDSYVSFLKRSIPSLIRSKKIVVDGGNGCVGVVLEALVQNTKLPFIPMHWEPTGAFEKYSPNPLNKERITALSQRVKKEHADFGCSFDDDGDRVIFVDEKGKFILPDFILALLAGTVLEVQSGWVVVPVNASHAVKEEVLSHGGNVGVSRVGRSFVADKMHDLHALLGGEISGHYYFKEFLGADSGVLALLKVLGIYEHSEVAFSKLFLPFQKYSKSFEMSVVSEHWTSIKNALKHNYKDAQIDELDGVTVEYPEWWANVRPSNTEPLVRFVVEAKSKKIMEEKLKEIEKIVKK